MDTCPIYIYGRGSRLPTWLAGMNFLLAWTNAWCPWLLSNRLLHRPLRQRLLYEISPAAQVATCRVRYISRPQYHHHSLEAMYLGPAAKCCLLHDCDFSLVCSYSTVVAVRARLCMFACVFEMCVWERLLREYDSIVCMFVHNRQCSTCLCVQQTPQSILSITAKKNAKSLELFIASDQPAGTMMGWSPPGR